MLATVQSGALVGLDAVKVTVEVDYNPRGMTGFTIVGLPDAAVQESRERVRSAVRNRGLDFPNQHHLLRFRIAAGTPGTCTPEKYRCLTLGACPSVL